MFARLFRKLAASKRAQYAIIGNGCVSVASLTLSVAVARQSSVAVFAEFSLAIAAFIFVTGLVRAALTDTSLAVPEDSEVASRSLRRSGLVAIVASVLLVGVGLIARSPYLTILGVAFHGLIALDVCRTIDASIGNARRGLIFATSWAALTILSSVLVAATNIAPLVAYTSWAAGGALAGYLALVVCRHPRHPGWPRNPKETKASIVFTCDYLVGSGGSALTTGLVGGLADQSVIAALRGGSTILGPVNLIATSANSLIIPVLARASARRNELAMAAKLTLGLGAAVLPLMIIIQAIPDRLGEWLLGPSWAVASLALLPLTVEALFALLSRVPASGHRAVFAGKRTLILRLTLGIPRPFVVVGAAFAWGIQGAAWAMAAIAVLNTMLWWVSYITLPKADPSDTHTDRAGVPH